MRMGTLDDRRTKANRTQRASVSVRNTVIRSVQLSHKRNVQLAPPESLRSRPQLENSARKPPTTHDQAFTRDDRIFATMPVTKPPTPFIDLQQRQLWHESLDPVSCCPR